LKRRGFRPKESRAEELGGNGADRGKKVVGRQALEKENKIEEGKGEGGGFYDSPEKKKECLKILKCFPLPERASSSRRIAERDHIAGRKTSRFFGIGAPPKKKKHAINERENDSVGGEVGLRVLDLGETLTFGGGV